MHSSVVPGKSTVPEDRGDSVEVLYALPAEQHIVSVPWSPGLTAARAVESSGLPDRFPEIAAGPLVLGIWGMAVRLEHVLKAGDRVEISRPLVADPRDMRRELMAGGRVMGGASGPVVRKPGRE